MAPGDRELPGVARPPRSTAKSRWESLEAMQRTTGHRSFTLVMAVPGRTNHLQQRLVPVIRKLADEGWLDHPATTSTRNNANT